jgi:hypothetical protein
VAAAPLSMYCRKSRASDSQIAVLLIRDKH